MMLLIDSARFLILINISLENNNNAFRKHLPDSRSKMTRVLLIGRVEVIYDVLSEPKIYPTLHVSYIRTPVRGTHAERCPEVPIVLRRVRVI